VIAGAGLLFWRGRTGYGGFLLGLGLVAFTGFSYLPWWLVFTAVLWLSWRMVGVGFAVAAAAMMLGMTLAGHWQDAMYSVYLCSAAVLICLLFGCPLGILASKNDLVSRIMQPVNDTLQSIPLYIFLIPAVALFQVNEFSALVAIVLYAIVPIVRYTNMDCGMCPQHWLRQRAPMAVQHFSVLSMSNFRWLGHPFFWG